MTTMKTLSLKLDDNIFEDTEKITAKLNIPRNRYINQAVDLFNHYNNRKLLKMQLHRESALIREDSMNILHEFEQIRDQDQAI
ncbi:MAG: hypothetical protein ACKORJ_03220 [Bacteroidota bacterium]